MLRYLLKTLLQMNLFTDSLRDHNGTDPFLNGSIPPYNGSMLDWGNFTGFNAWRGLCSGLERECLMSSQRTAAHVGQLNCAA
ncbi:unnamed protein product [Gadus morhua 'NCC']